LPRGHCELIKCCGWIVVSSMNSISTLIQRRSQGIRMVSPGDAWGSFNQPWIVILSIAGTCSTS
jgi:hypothetical protein